MTTTANKPVHTIRDGAIRATIWKNTGKNGEFFSVQVTRTYRTTGGFRDSNRFTAGELLKVAQVATEVHDYLEGLDSSPTA
jgi:hypothetical protein